MTDLTVLCVSEGASHARPFLEGLERLAGSLDADWLLVSDGEDLTSKGFLESILDEAVSLCQTRYVLRLDDDERPTPGMVDWLRSGAYREHDHWAFPRLNLWPNAWSYIRNEPLYPDLQTRLSVKAKAGGRRQVHVGSPYGTGMVAPCAIEHHKFLVRSFDEREALVDRYEQITPGAGKGYAMFSLPELYEADLVIEATINRKAATMLEAFDRLPAGATVVEIGCARFGHEVPSDGWSTVHLARAAADRRWRAHSVDIDPAAVQCARAAIDGLPVTVHEDDGEAWLRGFDGPIDGLYLDGSAEPQEALAQYFAARLAGRAVVAVDDVQALDGHAYGKGHLLLDQLRHDGFTVEIRDTEPGYRMAVAYR